MVASCRCCKAQCWPGHAGGGWGTGAGQGEKRKEGKCSLEEEENLGAVRKDNTLKNFTKGEEVEMSSALLTL